MKSILPWSLVAVLGFLLLAAAQQNSAPPAKAQQPQGAQQARPPGANLQDLGDRLVAALKGIDGCLGVTTGDLSENRNAIFAFFENKEAALRWYNHPMHTQLRGTMGEAAPEGYVPLKDVPDGVPVMTAAVISFAGPPAIPGSQIPFHAISIETYVPAGGGLRINGGFAPDKFAELAQQQAPAKQK